MCSITVYSTTTSAGKWSFRKDGSEVSYRSSAVRCTTETKVYLFDKLLVRSENHDGKCDDVTGADHVALQIDAGCVRLDGRILAFIDARHVCLQGHIKAFINGQDVNVPFVTKGDIKGNTKGDTKSRAVSDLNRQTEKCTLTDVGLDEWAKGLCKASKMFMQNEGRRHLDGRKVQDHKCEGKITSWDLSVDEESLTLEFAYKQQQRMVLK